MFLMTCQYVDVWPTDCGHDGQETTTVCNPQLALKMDQPLNTDIFAAIIKLNQREYLNTTTNFRFAANMFTFAIYHRRSICRLSVMSMHPTQAIVIFGNVSMPFGTLDISDLSVKILLRSSQGKAIQHCMPSEAESLVTASKQQKYHAVVV